MDLLVCVLQVLSFEVLSKVDFQRGQKAEWSVESVLYFFNMDLPIVGSHLFLITIYNLYFFDIYCDYLIFKVRLLSTTSHNNMYSKSI